jgi:hypothetical protein
VTKPWSQAPFRRVRMTSTAGCQYSAILDVYRVISHHANIWPLGNNQVLDKDPMSCNPTAMKRTAITAHLVDMWNSFPAVTECIPELPHHKGGLAGLHVLCHMSSAEALNKVQPAHGCLSDNMTGTLAWTRTPGIHSNNVPLLPEDPCYYQCFYRLRSMWDIRR